MLPIDTSILKYDRTQADSYEAADLNRVGGFCQTVVTAATDEAEIIKQMRDEYDVAENPFVLPDFKVPHIQVKIDFALTDTYTLEQMQQYLENVTNIVSAFPPMVYKTLPTSMRFLTAEGANNIEEDLKGSAESLAQKSDKIKANIKNTASAFQYSGEIYAGGLI